MHRAPRRAEQLAERGRLAVDVAAAGVKVERQHPPAARSRIVDRHRARLGRRLRGQRPRVPGGIGAAAVTARSGRAEYPRSRA